MSKTDNTISPKAFARQQEVEYWWDSPEASSRWCIYGMPTKGKYAPPPRPGMSRTKASYRKSYWGGERNKVRMALLKHQEPEPSRTRRSISWKLY